MWRSRPVFISSTFHDMQAERDHLRNFVFPELEERLRGRRHHLEWVDLRLGVATAAVAEEDARELTVLKVCLAEVRRCRPFLLVLLGDRYGWVPPAGRMAAAAAEEGLDVDLVGRSVTELEIEFGVLRDPDQQPLSLFYFREPLPYAQMPADQAAAYSDAFDPAPAAAERVARLAALKQRIAERLPARVRRYGAQWDGRRVTGLDAWGRSVVEDVWAALAAQTLPAATSAEVSWQEEERTALDDFAEDRARDFVGRQPLLARLGDFAVSPAEQEGGWGICVTGAPGSGKSAVFGELYRRLRRSDVLLLAHAAGASPRAASVDSMLRRWIEALAAALRVDAGLAEDAGPEAVEAAFASLLGRAGKERRVVVLVDALDQFELTTRGRFATWLPRSPPAGTRFVATAVSGDASQALSARPGLELLPLPPLAALEARGIIESICARYHRVFEPEVIAALLAKAGADGPAWGSPLWLMLAVEELNLLDADDFARADRSHTGTPAERLRSIMLEIIAGFPADPAGLYDVTFDRAEELFGPFLVQSFLALIAVSRGGWRERDFRVLLPRLTGEPWDELRFASLRRVFRGQMHQHGTGGQWDFNHGQMRQAVKLRLTHHAVRETDLHATIADHLLQLGHDDPLRQSETMVHLLASEDWARAARYYGGNLDPAEQRGAAQVLIDTALLPAGDGADSGRERVLHLLDAGGADVSHQEYAVQRLLYHVFDPLRTQAPLDVQEALARRISVYFDRLIAFEPSLMNRIDVHRAASHGRLGNVLEARGDLAGAETSYRRVMAISEPLARRHPDVVEWQRDLSVGYNHLGKVQVAQRKLAAAVASFEASLAIIERVANAQPGQAEWQSDLSITHINVGDVRLAQGDVVAAEASYRAALTIDQRLAAAEPGNLDRQFALSTALGRIWRLEVSRGDLTAAESCVRVSIAILDRLVAREPGNLQWRHALSLGHRDLSLVQEQGGRFAEAEASLRTSLSMGERLAREDPAHADWQRDLVTGHAHLAEAQHSRGDLVGAEAAWRAAIAAAELLVARNPHNAALYDALAGCYHKLRLVQGERGDLAGAQATLKALRAAEQAGTRARDLMTAGRRDATDNPIGETI